MAGRPLVVAAWCAVALLAIVTAGDVAGVDAFDGAATAVALGSFFVSLVVWAVGFAVAVVRTTRGDDIAVASLFFLSGSAPAEVRRHLLGATGASVVVAAVGAAANPFVVLAPMLPLGLAGLWGSRHGVFPPRPPAPARGRR